MHARGTVAGSRGAQDPWTDLNVRIMVFLERLIRV